MKKQTYSLFPKKLANGSVIYYYSVYKTDRYGKEKRVQYSTGKTTFEEALKVVHERERENKLIPRTLFTYRNYSENFFNPYGFFFEMKAQRGYEYAKSTKLKYQLLNQHCFIPFFGDKMMAAISPMDIETYLLERKRTGVKNSTLNRELNVLKLLFHEACRNHDIQFDPTKDILKYKNETVEKGIFSELEIEKLFYQDNSLNKIWSGFEVMYLLNLTALKTGMRLGELLALRVEDIVDGCFVISHSYNSAYGGLSSTKTKKSRTIPVNYELLEEITEMLGFRESGYVFSVNNGITPVSRQSVYRTFYNAMESIGLDRNILTARNITFHSWRHTFASDLANKNAPELYIRKLTGHSSQSVFNNYTHLQTEQLRKYI